MRNNLIIGLIVVLLSVVSGFYGTGKVKEATGEQSPDAVIESGTDITVDLSEGLTLEKYFDNDISGVKELNNDADIVVKIKVLDDRIMSAYSTRTAVKIEKIYKDKNQELSEGENVYLIEPATFLRDEVYMTEGYQLAHTGYEYIAFLKHLICVDGYQYQGDEKISFMPVSEYYGKYDLGEEDLEKVIEGGEDISYQSVSDSPLLTEDANRLATYRNLKTEVLDSYQ